MSISTSSKSKGLSDRRFFRGSLIAGFFVLLTGHSSLLVAQEPAADPAPPEVIVEPPVQEPAPKEASSAPEEKVQDPKEEDVPQDAAVDIAVEVDAPPALVEEIVIEVGGEIEIDGVAIEIDANGGVVIQDNFVFGGGMRQYESAADATRLVHKVTDQVQEDAEVMFDYMEREIGVPSERVGLLRGCTHRLIQESIAKGIQKQNNTWIYGGARDRSVLTQLLDNELWKRCYNTALTAEQKEQFEKHQEARRKRALEARVELLCAALDARLCLSGEQCDKIRPLIQRALERNHHSHYGTDMVFMNPYYLLGGSNAEALKDVLDDDQKKDVDENSQRWSNGTSENLLESFLEGVEE